MAISVLLLNDQSSFNLAHLSGLTSSCSHNSKTRDHSATTFAQECDAIFFRSHLIGDTNMIWK